MTANRAERADLPPAPASLRVDPALLTGWLQHQLADRWDGVLAEPIPTELVDLLPPAH